MARTILITGGSRSGKSAYAQKLAESLPGRRVFVATCPPVDEEMRQRIARHRRERQARHWDTIEETVDLAEALRGTSAYDVVLVDCLTLWINNLMYEAEHEGGQIEEDAVARRGAGVLEACQALAGTVVFVTNEVGMGIVPENAATRRYRDLVGRCNQVIATGADAVRLITCGMPLELK